MENVAYSAQIVVLFGLLFHVFTWRVHVTLKQKQRLGKLGS